MYAEKSINLSVCIMSRSNKIVPLSRHNLSCVEVRVPSRQFHGLQCEGSNYYFVLTCLYIFGNVIIILIISVTGRGVCIHIHILFISSDLQAVPQGILRDRKSQRSCVCVCVCVYI